MYSGLSSAITPALLSPAEATGSVAVPPSAEPSAPTPPPPPPTSRYRLDDFSRAQQLQRQQPFANGSDGRKRQAFYEERRQPDKLDFGTIRGKEEEDKSHLSHCGVHLSRFNCSLSGGVDILAPRNAFANDDEEAGGRRGGGTREKSGRTHLSVVRSCSLAPTAKCETAMIIRPSTRQS